MAKSGRAEISELLMWTDIFEILAKTLLTNYSYNIIRHITTLVLTVLDLLPVPRGLFEGLDDQR